MASEKLPTFSFSPSALAKIEELRKIYENHNKVNTDAIMIGWGSNSESGKGGIVLSFFSVIETIEILDSLQVINGLKVQLFTTPKFYSKFDRKIIDFSKSEGFSLRDQG